MQAAEPEAGAILFVSKTRAKTERRKDPWPSHSRSDRDFALKPLFVTHFLQGT